MTAHSSPAATQLEDIHSRKQIQLLVDLFYLQVRQDELLGPVFNHAIEDWQQYLPRMYQFWEKLLFGVEGYSGNPFQKHLALQLGAEHFEAWVRIFNNTVQENFAGAKAEQAKKLCPEYFQYLSIENGHQAGASGALIC